MVEPLSAMGDFKTSNIPAEELNIMRRLTRDAYFKMVNEGIRLSGG